MEQAVFISGVGLCTPLGHDLDAVTSHLMSGHDVFQTIDTTYSKSIPAAVLHDPELDADNKEGLVDKTTRMSQLAARRALDDAGVIHDSEWKRSCAVSVGNGCGLTESSLSVYEYLFETKRAGPLTVLRCMPSSASCAIAMDNGMHGAAQTYNAACASSTIAIGEALRAIRHGYIDRVLVGGTEASLEPSLLKAWEALRILAPASKQAGLVCKPFDRHRKGLVLGEGSVFFVLESERSVRARQGRAYANLLGYGVSSDSHHWTTPHIHGQCLAMTRAMNDAKVMPSDIVAINAHGTSTTIGDKVELESLLTVFSDSAIPVVSTKSIHGHMLGASGAMELVTCLISLSTKKIPATRNLSDPEPSGQLILVRDHPIEIAKAGPILSNSFAFGGSNACLVIGPIDV